MMKIWAQYDKERKKMSRDFQIALIRLRLSVPEPTSYNLWYTLHCYLEKLENMEMDD